MAEHDRVNTLIDEFDGWRQQAVAYGIAPQQLLRVVPNGRMLAWQVRLVRDYIDSHIARRVLVADLCALVQRSDAHFSRSFKRTLGEPPHAFVVRRRVELAAQ